jgi:hypothetical protein
LKVLPVKLPLQVEPALAAQLVLKGPVSDDDKVSWIVAPVTASVLGLVAVKLKLTCCPSLY